MARKPRKPSKPRPSRKCKKVSKVRHGKQFLYTFDCRRNDGTRQTIQLVFPNDDRGALRLAERLLDGYGYGYGGYAYWEYGYGGYGYWSYAY
jgi:hypothetical protein